MLLPVSYSQSFIPRPQCHVYYWLPFTNTFYQAAVDSRSNCGLIFNILDTLNHK